MEAYGIPVDVMTCDPEHYVRCALMLDAVRHLPPEVMEILHYHEWTLREPGGYEMFCALNCRTTPTLLVNGERKFENYIPTVDELYGALMSEARTEEQRLVLSTAWRRANQEYPVRAATLT
ncbi:MAG: hypothetical protein M5U22_07800 [Thermoleophilia bacterium]|nr:hypothetical protein [Thermoleophilia bacterium]